MYERDAHNAKCEGAWNERQAGKDDGKEENGNPSPRHLHAALCVLASNWERGRGLPSPARSQAQYTPYRLPYMSFSV